MPRKRISRKGGWPPNVQTILNAPGLARKPKETDLKYQLRLVKMAAKQDVKVAEARYQSNLVRLKLGGLLLLQEPKKIGLKGPWKLAKAQELGVSTRVLQRILHTARAFQIGIPIPDEILRRPFNTMAQTVEVWVATGEVKSRRTVDLLASLSMQLHRMVERSTQLTPKERRIFKKALGDAASALTPPKTA